MSCPDCGAVLDDVPVGLPCPQCGGSRRDVAIDAKTIEARAEFPEPTVVLGYGDPRPWQQKWQDVLDALQQVERAYTNTEGRSSDDIRRDIEDFFKTCRELADWLWQNAGYSDNAVRDFLKQDPHLRLADGMAQTTKHHTRTGRDPITAHIVELRSGPSGLSATIGWSTPSGASGSQDARDLARECVNAWRNFLSI